MKLTKQGILVKLATIYDPLGLISPKTLCGKLIYRSVCNKKRAWDTQLSRDMVKAWLKWEGSLPQSFEVPRLLALHWEEIEGVKLHSFGDASANGVCHSSGGQDKPRSDCFKVKTLQTRPDYSAAWPRSHIAVNLITNIKRLWRITLNKHALLAGQFSCLVLD